MHRVQRTSARFVGEAEASVCRKRRWLGVLGSNVPKTFSIGVLGLFELIPVDSDHFCNFECSTLRIGLSQHLFENLSQTFGKSELVDRIISMFSHFLC